VLVVYLGFVRAATCSGDGGRLPVTVLVGAAGVGVPEVHLPWLIKGGRLS